MNKVAKNNKANDSSPYMLGLRMCEYTLPWHLLPHCNLGHPNTEQTKPDYSYNPLPVPPVLQQLAAVSCSFNFLLRLIYFEYITYNYLSHSL
jgi:hypothetical protein